MYHIRLYPPEHPAQLSKNAQVSSNSDESCHREKVKGDICREKFHEPFRAFRA